MLGDYASTLRTIVPQKFSLDDLLYRATISMPIGFLTVYPCLLQGSVVIAIATWLGNGYLAWYILMISRIADKALAKNGVYTRPVTGLPEPGRGASFPFSEPFFLFIFYVYSVSELNLIYNIWVVQSRGNQEWFLKAEVTYSEGRRQISPVPGQGLV